MSALPGMSEQEYLEMEEAVSATAKGRAFLRMRDRRASVIAGADVKEKFDELRGLLSNGVPIQDAAEGSGQMGFLRRELQEMSAYVQQTRKEIAALRPDAPSKNRIVLATGELDAIVSATERATSEILSAAERIQAAAARVRAEADSQAAIDEINAQVTEILMACSFQDITGQRTTKVVNTLRYIETRINSMIAIWGPEGLENVVPVADATTDARPDAHLLNGPSMDGVSQGEVDDMFNGSPIPAPAAKPAMRNSPVTPPPASLPVAAATLTDQSAVDALFN